MRLLKTDDLDAPEFVEFFEESVPKYAILSHTWGKEEVTLQEFQGLEQRLPTIPTDVTTTATTIKAKKGFLKIRKAATLAAEHGYRFIWVDTCCIDKTSSAELSEAINSMFQWYKRASICYAYLEDVKRSTKTDDWARPFHSECQHNIIFYNQDWVSFGRKSNNGVRFSLSHITGIDAGVLAGTVQPSEISIAGRMKWASRRETTRLEDIAYCLMGIFDVNMPLLYGEGVRAFIRLQEEILRDSNDHSIFTWKTTEQKPDDHHSGLLARSPRDFAEATKYRPMPPLISQGSITCSITNQGLRISLFLLPARDRKGARIPDEYDAVLDCAVRHRHGDYQSPVIRMRRLYGDQFARIAPGTVRCVTTPSLDLGHGVGSFETVFVKQKPVNVFPEFMASYTNILETPELQGPGLGCYIVGVWPEQNWDREAAILRIIQPRPRRVTGIFRFFAPAIDATVDFAFGLEKEHEGAWKVWHLQRASTKEPLHKIMSSVNTYLEGINREFGQNAKTPDGKVQSWHEGSGNTHIQISIDEIEVYGRPYFLVKASSGFELDADPPRPEPVASLVGIRPTEKRQQTEETPDPLEQILGELTTSDGPEYYLRFGTRMEKKPAKIRTPWVCPLAKNLAELNIQGIGENETMLLHACRDGRVRDLLDLIDHDLECITLAAKSHSAIPPPFNGFRPIHWAVVGGHIDVIRILLDHGVYFNARTSQGWSLLHVAALCGRFTTMKWLMEYAYTRHRGSHDLEFSLSDKANILQENPLHIAVAVVDSRDEDELVAFHALIRNREGDAVWSSANQAGESPIHRWVTNTKCWDVTSTAYLASLLRVHGGVVDKLDRTPLWHAACCGFFRIPVEEYIKSDATILSKGDKYGMTPLHAACRYGKLSMIHELLELGADPDATTVAPGLTATHFVALYAHHDCLEMLIRYRADVHKPTSGEGIHFRPIHLAAAFGHGGRIRMLREAGADMDERCDHILTKEFKLVKSFASAAQLASLIWYS
ncbi:hypothetical protein F4808DRAFT_461801 [Astrocystis sublimbata]|nr:hypothetical protein F4808DRAFT_461801 [Astrocystis sublimbata]